MSSTLITTFTAMCKMLLQLLKWPVILFFCCPANLLPGLSLLVLPPVPEGRPGAAWQRPPFGKAPCPAPHLRGCSQTVCG